MYLVIRRCHGLHMQPLGVSFILVRFGPSNHMYAVRQRYRAIAFGSKSFGVTRGAFRPEEGPDIRRSICLFVEKWAQKRQVGTDHSEGTFNHGPHKYWGREVFCSQYIYLPGKGSFTHTRYIIDVSKDPTTDVYECHKSSYSGGTNTAFN